MRRRLATFIVLCGVATAVAASASPNRPVSRVARYEYIAGVGRLSVYNIANQALVERFALPGVAEVRGIGASPVTGMLYVSYGGFPRGVGHLLEFSLYRHRVVYDRAYRFGIDSFDVSHDGRLIFMPTGENTSGNTWHVLAAATGRAGGPRIRRAPGSGPPRSPRPGAPASRAPPPMSRRRLSEGWSRAA